MLLSHPQRPLSAVRASRFLQAFTGGLLGLSGVASADTFTGLGLLPNATSSVGWAISADGTMVVGTSGGPSSTTNRAFRWTSYGGMRSLGSLPGSSADTYGLAVSSDGLVAAGYANNVPSSSQRPFRWTIGVGMANLGVPADWDFAQGYGVSGDGSVVVGTLGILCCDATRGFRWTAAGMQVLTALPSSSPDIYSRAAGISRDGSTIVGTSGDFFNDHSVRWTTSGIQNLGALAGGSHSFGYAANLDGSVVVGQSSTSLGILHAFRWLAGSMQDLGVLPGTASSVAHAVSDDGTVVVGASGTGAGSRAFLWRSQEGIIDLQDYLQSRGLDLTGWTLTTANAIGASGSTFAGTGVHNGVTEAWTARLGFYCYPDCDTAGPPLLSINDFICFQARFAAGDPYANCDGSTAAPVLTVADFVCFQSAFAAGCP